MGSQALQIQTNVVPFTVIKNEKKKRKEMANQQSQSGDKKKQGSSLVYPIKDLAELQLFLNHLKTEAEDMSKLEYDSFISARNYLLVMIGLNSAYRISDIISLKWKDVFDKKGDFKEVNIQEKKTKKYREFYLNDMIKMAIAIYLRNKNVQNYLEKVTGSRQPNLNDYIFVTKRSNESKHINSNTARLMLKEIADKVGIKANIGTHTLRKTFVYHTLKNNPTSLPMLMECLNHSSEAMTLRYATITGDEVNKLYDGIGEMYSKMIGG